MAIGENKYRNATDLEPIANAVTSMGQSASKKDKPDVLANKIKAISTDATGTEGEMLAGKTFYADGNKKTGSMANRGAWTNRLGINGKIVIPQGYHDGNGYVDQSIPVKGAQIYTPSIVNQVINAGQYLSGGQTIVGDPNLKPENIVKGKTIFGVEGSYVSLPPLFIIKNGQWQNSFGTLMALPAYPTSRFERVQNSGNYMEFFTASTGNSKPHCMEVLSKVLDVTNYNRMVIKFASEAFPNLIDIFDIFLVPTNRISEVKLQGHSSSLVLGADYSPVYYNTSSSTASDDRILEWDLSTLTGAYYLVIHAQSAGYYNNLSVCISNIYLSAEPIIKL